MSERTRTYGALLLLLVAVLLAFALTWPNPVATPALGAELRPPHGWHIVSYSRGIWICVDDLGLTYRYCNPQVIHNGD